MDEINEKDFLQELNDELDNSWQDLGSVIEITGMWADGPNRDGGWVTGNNFSFQ